MLTTEDADQCKRKGKGAQRYAAQGEDHAISRRKTVSRVTYGQDGQTMRVPRWTRIVREAIQSLFECDLIHSASSSEPVSP